MPDFLGSNYEAIFVPGHLYQSVKVFALELREMKAFIHSELDATASPPSLHTLSSMEKQNALPWATPHREKRVSNSSRVDVDFFVPVGLLGETLDALSLLEVDESEFEDSTAHTNSPKGGDLELSPQLEGPDKLRYMMARCGVVLTAG